jgi:alpha-mannosidase
VNAYPQKRFVDVSNGVSGLAVLNRGLPEYEVLRDGPGLTQGQSALAITLLRCVEWLSRGDLATRRGPAGPLEHTPEAQCLGHHEFDYALVPHQGSWEDDDALVLREAQAFNTPLTSRVVVTQEHAGLLPSRASLVEVEPRALVVSALKRHIDGLGLVVRVYNPLDHEVEARITPGIAFQHVFMTNLLEERQQPLELAAGAQSVQVNIRSGGITTLLFA